MNFQSRTLLRAWETPSAYTFVLGGKGSAVVVHQTITRDQAGRKESITPSTVELGWCLLVYGRYISVSIYILYKMLEVIYKPCRSYIICPPESSDKPKPNDADMLLPDSLNSQIPKFVLASKILYLLGSSSQEKSRAGMEPTYIHNFLACRPVFSSSYCQQTNMTNTPSCRQLHVTGSRWTLEINLRVQFYTMVDVQTSH